MARHVFFWGGAGVFGGASGGGGHVWHCRGVCMEGGGMCGGGGMHVAEGHVWHGGDAWWGMFGEVSVFGGASVFGGGACMAGGGVHGRAGDVWHGGVRAGETTTEAGGTHPTGIHSCFHSFQSCLVGDTHRVLFHHVTSSRGLLNLKTPRQSLLEKRFKKVFVDIHATVLRVL